MSREPTYQALGLSRPMVCDISPAGQRSMTANHEQDQGVGFRAFMLKHQYKVMLVSLVIGLMWLGIRYLVAASWFYSRLCLLFALISFVPAGLVVLVHGRELGIFLWWDRSNVVLTMRRSSKREKVELVVMAALWSVIFAFVVFVIFVLER
jgi:hypothetical protein